MVREVASRILADGHAHESTEIRQAVRAAGLSPNNLVSALKGRFEKYTNAAGTVVYRDTDVPYPTGDAQTYDPKTWMEEE
jgi:hypothetical protein